MGDMIQKDYQQSRESVWMCAKQMQGILQVSNGVHFEDGALFLQSI